MAKIDPEREARLAAALRDNLKRRKVQARAVADPCSRESGSPEIGPGLPLSREHG